MPQCQGLCTINGTITRRCIRPVNEHTLCAYIHTAQLGLNIPTSKQFGNLCKCIVPTSQIARSIMKPTSLTSSWRYPHLVELLWQQNILMLYISTAVLSSCSSRALASIQYHSDDICICLRRS